MAANLDPLNLGSSAEYGRVPLDEAELNALDRGIIARARRAGFEVETLLGSGPGGSSTRVAATLVGGGPGLVRFSITRPHGVSTLTKPEVWVQFRHWPQRKSTLAEIRAELEDMIRQRSR